jgi:formyltetrahydrofolate synthetase
MDEVLKIVAIIALTSITLLVVYLIVFLSKTLKVFNEATKNLDKITENITVLRTRMMITLEEFTEVRKEVSDIKEKALEHLNHWKTTSDKTNNLIDNINDGASNVINAIEPYERLINRSYDRIAPPIDKATTVFSALFKAIEVFGSKLNSRK